MNSDEVSWRRIFSETERCVCWPTAPDLASVESPRWLLPGAFNPMHSGHRGMANWVTSRLGGRVEFELSIINVEKPPLTEDALGSRVAQFRPDDRLWLTRAPTFAEKARLFPGTTFVVGADTIQRVADTRFHGKSEKSLHAAWQAIADQGCSFLVFGRLLMGRFQCLEEMNLPSELLAICQGVPEVHFRSDVSSTQIRRAQEEV